MSAPGSRKRDPVIIHGAVIIVGLVVAAAIFIFVLCPQSNYHDVSEDGVYQVVETIYVSNSSGSISFTVDDTWKGRAYLVVCEEEADVVLTEYSLPSHFINNGTRSNTSWSWFMAAGQESTMINVFDNSSGSDQYAGVWSMEISVKGGKVSCLVERIVTPPPSL